MLRLDTKDAETSKTGALPSRSFQPTWEADKRRKPSACFVEYFPFCKRTAAGQTMWGGHFLGAGQAYAVVG